MPTINLSKAGLSKATDARALRGRWERLLDGLLPAPDADRLVPVADLTRAAVPIAEASLADAEIAPVIQQTRTMNGDARFVVLVPVRSANVAKEALGGL